MNDTHTTQEPIAPILRAIFPELSEKELLEIHEGFVRLFDYLDDEWLKERGPRVL